MSLPRHAVVTVTFNPDVAVLGRQLGQCGGADVVVVVDNASGEASALERLVGATPRAVLIRNSSNLGLAAALNAGAAEALTRHPDCAFVLFLDQDTEPGPDGVRRLVEAAAGLREREPRLGLVGPLMVDAATGLDHGIHVIRGWRWARVHPVPGAAAPVPCASVNGSGMLVPVEVFKAAGGFDESLFIDHVDSEYSFRLAHAGRTLFTVPGVRFAHRMGDKSLRFWFGRWRVWPCRPPARHYYLVRNAVALMRRDYPPRVWKAWTPAKLLLTACVHALVDRERRRQFGAMLAGLRAGLSSPGLQPRVGDGA